MGAGRLKTLGQISHCYEVVESDSGPHLRVGFAIGGVADPKNKSFVFFSLEETATVDAEYYRLSRTEITKLVYPGWCLPPFRGYSPCGPTPLFLEKEESCMNLSRYC